MRSSSFLLVAGLMAAAPAVHGQTAAGVMRGPDYTTSSQVPGVDVLTLPHMPFSGTDQIAWTRTLVGGTTMTSYLVANLARDGQGRVYRERHHFGVKGASPQSTLIDTVVYDPVTMTVTRCLYQAHQCTATAYHPHAVAPLLPEGAYDEGKRVLSRERLGAKEIGGLSVTGTRETTTMLPGAIGNDQTLTMVREFWYCPELKTNLAVTRKDPREGVQDVQVTILSRSEPDPGVFAAPAGFTVRDMRRGVGGSAPDGGSANRETPANR